MNNQKHRVLLISSQPIQNPVPLQHLSQFSQLEILVAYCSLPDTKLWQGVENLNKEVFDTPMLNGYPWNYVPNRSPVKSLGKFFGLINPGLIKLVSQCHCCVVFGHSYLSFWLAIIATKLMGKPLLLSTDATYLNPPEGQNWKVPLKRWLLPRLYNRIADSVIVPSTASKRFIHSLGVPEERIFITPYVVDNEGIAATARKADCKRIRADWQIPETAWVVLFVAKFLERKRPQDLLRAFAAASVPNSYLVFVGEGPLSNSLRSEAQQLGVDERVSFLGLVKYSKLPEVYAASDLLVHPAEWEPYGLIVNEAMVCGVPVIVSDRVGASCDLVQEGVTGFTYPWGKVEKLAELLRETLSDRQRMQWLGQAAQQRMQTWSSRENAEGTLEAIERAFICKQSKTTV